MNYTFEYLFIPKIVANSNKAGFEFESVEIFDYFEFTPECLSEHYPDVVKKFDWDNFFITKEMSKSIEYWLFRFPQPTKIPEAKWGIIVHKKDKPFKYYTLATGDNNKMELYNVEEDAHRIVDIFTNEMTIDEFVNEALSNY